MEGDEAEAGTPLIQQRRFLILVSLLVFACYSLGIYVRNEGEYNGFTVKLLHPDRVIIGLWVIWAWALLRYFQRAYERLSELGDDIVRAVDSEDRRLAIRSSRKEARKQARSGEIGDGRSNVRITLVAWGRERSQSKVGQDNEKTSEGEIKEDPYFITTEGGGRSYKGLTGVYSWFDETHHNGQSSFNFNMEWSPWRVKRHRFAAWIHSTLKLPAISEHVAPILIATCALASPFLFHRDSIPSTESPKASAVGHPQPASSGVSSGSSGQGKK